MFGLKARTAKREAARREIFRYWDGEKERGIDPLEVFFAFKRHPTFNLEKHPAAALGSTPDMEALQILLDATREVFSVPKWRESSDGTSHGLANRQVIELFCNFSAWMDGVKKNTSMQPI